MAMKTQSDSFLSVLYASNRILRGFSNRVLRQSLHRTVSFYRLATLPFRGVKGDRAAILLVWRTKYGVPVWLLSSDPMTPTATNP